MNKIDIIVAAGQGLIHGRGGSLLVLTVLVKNLSLLTSLKVLTRESGGENTRFTDSSEKTKM